MNPAQPADSGTVAKTGAVAPDATIDVPKAAVLAPPVAENGATLQAGAAAQTATTCDRPLPVIDGYEIFGELGRGGMGVVYRARQTLLNRPCVLKTILAGAHADTEAVLRFLAEAEAVARVQHPNVVHIHHVGQTAGLPFIELEFVEGGSLDRRLDGTPWPPRQAAQLVEAMAQGVAAAHRHGIVHRDLKPANILMAGGIPKITDFGLAKSLSVESGLTQTGKIMGSPAYMAPEQAEGKARHVGPLADVYALCAILYELLTGWPPFRGATVLETLEQVKSVEPVPPSRLVPSLPRDIETIALKGLQKEPAKRYDSAAALAADLQRFLGGDSILARPVGPVERSWRWCRRHPGPALSTAAVVLVAALGLAGILWQWHEAVTARDIAAQGAVAEAAARRQAETTLVDMYTASGIQAGEQGEHARAALWFANAARLAKADPDREHANAIRARTWGRLALTPRAAFAADAGWPGPLLLHPDGQHLLSSTIGDGAMRDSTYTLWDTDAEAAQRFPGGASTAPAAAWSPDGRALAVGRDDGDVIVADFPGGTETARIPFPGRIRLVTYSGDGRYLAVAGGNAVRVWDCKNGAFITANLVHPAAVTTLAFHPEGRFLATGCRDDRARLFAVPGQSSEPLWPPVPHVQVEGKIWYPVFFAPPLFVDGGRGLLTYDGSVGITERDTATGAEVRTLRVSEARPGVAATRLSPDGRFLAVFRVQQPGIRLYEIATGRPVGPVLAHANTVFDAAFSPDGRTLVSSSSDRTVRRWSVPEGAEIGRPLDLHRTVHRVAFAPDGRSLITQDFELIRGWTLPQEGLPILRVPLDGRASFVALGTDGTLAMATGMTYAYVRELRSTRPFDVAAGAPAGPAVRPGGPIVDAAFAPDGRSVATLAGGHAPDAADHTVAVWDRTSGHERWRAALPAEPRSLSYESAGRRLAVLCASGELIVFDAEAGRAVRRWQAHEPEPVAAHWVNNGTVRYSPDGRRVLTWGLGNDVRVWDADTGQPAYPPLRHRDKCHDVQFSPDGVSMALASYDHSVAVRAVATGTLIAALPEHPDLVYAAGFSPDGKLLVTACRDRTVRVWDWRAGKLVCPPFEHTRDATAATFTPDGRWVLSTSPDGTARVWDWHTGRAVTPALPTGGDSLSIVVTPDGKHAVVGGDVPALAVLDLAELYHDAGDANRLCEWAELAAGQHIHEGGGTVNLSAAEWLQRWGAWRH